MFHKIYIKLVKANKIMVKFTINQVSCGGNKSILADFCDNF